MKVELPFLAEGVEGGDVVQVLVKEGEQVTEGQSLIELETEKATVPVPAPAAGKVTRLLVHQGDHIKVGQALAELDGGNGDGQSSKTAKPEKSAVAPARQPVPEDEAAHAKSVEAKESKPSQASDQSKTQTQPASPDAPVVDHQDQVPAQPARADREADHSKPSGATIPAPPSIRRLARELGVDLTQVKGSEAGGRITAEDVKAYVRERSRGAGSPAGKDAQGAGGNVFSTMYGTERREALPSLRRKIAANMTQAWTNIPHVHQFQDADITDLMQLHKRYAPQFKQKGTILTLSSLFLKASVHALKLYPQMNASLDLTNGEVIYKNYYNIGVAVETPAGLIVPVIHNVDQKDLLQISLELADLADRTRRREVKLEELRGATFTVSNMGGLGAGPFTPIIYPPQVGILGVGKSRLTPVYRDGQLVPRNILRLCVAYDHRLVDGADGARFTNEIVKVLEDFQAMFLGL
ncbi:Pyruvate dehydrogenase complex, dihydrolipoyllysine-residue acetyltransferase E2 component [Nitrospira sp. KM1]|uniref:dihydrolipoamide acetyltransferase family protein n=1 Tax=Nitrospira sp. KM1 TaxID=1936990 RepID=UPI0013A791DF|nr:dihydrolipoamide acetyltransferase family protein [Nitrospira sp. KM1]BCA56417.1 Pyruvate dehydrogenase complex, dihydrolipoyllysine-residue acetyltransferase E2 component [Nitrospira sp. KM1]